MFKSLFTKYIVAFTAIIVTIFIILTSIIASLVNNYSLVTKRDLLSGASNAMAMYIQETYTGSDDVSLEQYFNSFVGVMRPTFTLLVANIEESTAIVTDTEGRIVFYMVNGTRQNVTDAFIDPAFVEPIIEGGFLSSHNNVPGLDTLGGMLDKKNFVYGTPVRVADTRIVGAVYLCTGDNGLGDLLNTMIRTVIMSSLWIMLAALIAVYFISGRIIAPLNKMIRAAKKFAAGQFDVRIPVTGHDEVAELSIAFNNMASSLASLEDMRRSFLANVSHDLRTPMTTITGFIDGILDGAIPPDKHEYYLNVIAQEVRRLSRLVTSLLDITRMQAGERKFNMTVFDVCELARQILISFEQKIEEKKLDVAFECDEAKMFAFADQDAIHQILYNICDNAVKFSREGGKYMISLAYKDRKIHVSVYNEGMGITAEDLPYVFERFYKSDKSRGLDKTGVGLGMFIAKTIVDAHEEKIWVESEYGSYCRFTFTLARVYHQPSMSGGKN